MIGGTPPGLGTLLLRLIPLGSRRAEVEADLLELFGERATSRGVRYARLRYYGDVLSLWRTRQAPVMHPPVPGSRGAFLREVGQDLSYALRLMRRSPAVVAIAVLGLGLAIGVSTSVFSFLNAVTFRPTGIVDPASTARVHARVCRRFRNVVALFGIPAASGGRAERVPRRLVSRRRLDRVRAGHRDTHDHERDVRDRRLSGQLEQSRGAWTAADA